MSLSYPGEIESTRRPRNHTGTQHFPLPLFSSRSGFSRPDRSRSMSFKTWLRRLLCPKKLPICKRKLKLEVEWLESRLAPSATLTTDQADYAPNSTATLYGSGF